MDEVTTVSELIDIITDYMEKYEITYVGEQDKLIRAIAVNSEGLLNLTTFSSEFEEKTYKTIIKNELAEVLIYSLALADCMCLDVDELIRQKIEYKKEWCEYYLKQEG